MWLHFTSAVIKMQHVREAVHSFSCLLWHFFMLKILKPCSWLFPPCKEKKKKRVCKYICESILPSCFYARLTPGVRTSACWEVAGMVPRVRVLADALLCNQWGWGMGRLLSARWQIARGRKEGSEAVHCCPLGRGSHPSSWGGGSALPVASQPLRKCASCFWGFIGLITFV